MTIQEDIAISGRQPVPSAEEIAVLDGIIEKYRARGRMTLSDICCTTAQAYSYGIMQGKRAERARRKGGNSNV